ncbi:hypothetical protein SNE26_00275 [Mucilaginibacter sp. cycad4]|uniref:hypothetical protein n=1 Tax=Mucilaginibacter sp. cycad4 TaxID=3342096 RepID=UPI002AAB477D|nr:hypothetical protein [Mucilaginibacter gossypii]WPV00202.1 hypothetical protein SNE26_00275 [Mucilaginibacter gossypii]
MKKPYLIIILLTLATLNKSYSSCLVSKTDTGKCFLVTGGYHNSGCLSIKRINIVKTSADLRRKQFFVKYEQIRDSRRDSGFVNAKLIRTGWGDGIFATRPGFYRHDLASAVPAGVIALSPADRKNFKISINQDSVKQMKDTICYAAGKIHRCLYAIVPVILSNQSDDTLKYINMSCSWLDAFTTDVESIKLLPSAVMEECWKNSPAIYMIAPHQRITFFIPVYFLTDMGKNKLFVSKAFKIGMSLFKYIEGTQFPFDILGLTLRREKDIILWSDDIVAL